MSPSLHFAFDIDAAHLSVYTPCTCSRILDLDVNGVGPRIRPRAVRRARVIRASRTPPAACVESVWISISTPMPKRSPLPHVYRLKEAPPPSALFFMHPSFILCADVRRAGSVSTGYLAVLLCSTRTRCVASLDFRSAFLPLLILISILLLCCTLGPRRQRCFNMSPPFADADPTRASTISPAASLELLPPLGLYAGHVAPSDAVSTGAPAPLTIGGDCRLSTLARACHCLYPFAYVCSGFRSPRCIAPAGS
ncbi:hypothetical protein K438DRAFT_1997361 [Mycena galopus ATCC 62051]|nr:hypothetical protein K438DRAFT_1997361 [Mycena galopus ATCC 62051]